MKKVLIITYYWPPYANAGVHRWLKFAKYLRDFGWEPIIYTPENNESSDTDESLQRDIPDNIEVIKLPIWEPYNLYKRFIGVKKNEKINVGFLSETSKPKLTEKISVWIRGNFFIPDARLFWIKPSLKFLSKYIENNKIDAIISTGPPHSMHMIALGLKKKFNIPWIADFRDPWTFIDFYDDLNLTPWANRKHHRYENMVLTNANKVVTVSHSWAKNLEDLGAKNVKVITNGYDTTDYDKSGVIIDKKFSITHIGSLVKTRNPNTFWKALSMLVKGNKDFAEDLEIKLVGKTDFTVMDSIEKHGLKSNLTKINFIPHNEVIRIIQQSYLLLLLVNNTPNSKGIIPGKFFEYLATGRPIIVIGREDGDISKILNDCKAGKVIAFDDELKMKEIISKYYEDYKKGILSSGNVNTEKYSRRELTSNLSDLLNNIIS